MVTLAGRLHQATGSSLQIHRRRCDPYSFVSPASSWTAGDTAPRSQQCLDDHNGEWRAAADVFSECQQPAGVCFNFFFFKADVRRDRMNGGELRDLGLTAQASYVAQMKT